LRSIPLTKQAMHHNSGTTDLILISKGSRIALLCERRQSARYSQWTTLELRELSVRGNL